MKTGESAYREKSPGPDIDAVMITGADGALKGYATQAPAGVQNIQNNAEAEYTDITLATGERNATATGSNEGCGGFTSIGLKGHYITLGFDFDIVADSDDAIADRITVYEVPNCALDEADQRVETAQVDISISSDGETWVPVDPHDFAGGETEFLARPWDGGQSAECEPCQAGEDCTP